MKEMVFQMVCLESSVRSPAIKMSRGELARSLRGLFEKGILQDNQGVLCVMEPDVNGDLDFSVAPFFRVSRFIELFSEDDLNG